MQDTIHPFLDHLGLGLDADDRSIRRAYARLLKQIDQEADAEGFQSLRQAYESALFWYAQNIQHTEQAAIAPIARDDEEPRVTQPTQEDRTSVAEDTESLPDLPGLAMQGNTPLSARENSEHVARALLAEMHEKLASGWPTNRDAARLWLDHTLDGDRLVDMDARFFFEWGMAGVLAEGWQPGKEFLFGPAIDCFGWRDDRGRLMAFGRPGSVVAAAIAELEFFDSLPESVRADQRSLIRRLREDQRPATSVLLKQMPMAERIEQLYPHWLHIITNTQTLERWREWITQIPKWRQRFARKPRNLTELPRSETNSSRWMWGFLIVLALSSLGKIAGQFSSQSPSTTVASSGSFLGVKPPGTSEFSPDARKSEIDRMFMGLPPKSPVDAIPTSSRQSSLGQDTLLLERPAIDASYLVPPKVAYPPLARRRGQEGRVIVSVIVEPDGKVRRAKVEKSSGHAILDEAAINAVLDATFVPAKNSVGNAIASTYKLPFNFTLSDEPSYKQNGNRNYGDTVRDAVLPHIVFNDPASGNPVAEVSLKLSADGSIQSHQLTKPSGNKAWDAAVLRALQRVQKLPKDQNGKVPPEMIIAFRPKA